MIFIFNCFNDICWFNVNVISNQVFECNYKINLINTTPLCLAVQKGNVEIVKFLLMNKKINVNDYILHILTFFLYFIKFLYIFEWNSNSINSISFNLILLNSIQRKILNHIQNWFFVKWNSKIIFQYNFKLYNSITLKNIFFFNLIKNHIFQSNLNWYISIGLKIYII